MHHDVQINNQYKNLFFSKTSVSAFFKALESMIDYPIPEGELSIAFLDNPSIAQLHNTFLNDPSPTDVITFPANPYFSIAGEICVSVDHALTSSQNLNIPFNEELTLYLVHGWLHLSGFNDLTDEQRDSMRTAENHVMSFLKKTGNIPNFHLL